MTTTTTADRKQFPIGSLPSELKRRTASYLCPQDALRLSETCKTIHSSLSLRLLRNSRVLFVRHFVTGSTLTGDRHVPFVPIPCISRRVHSITVSFRWHDQGFGNRKGQVWIVGRHRSAPVDPDHPFRGGRVVCTSPIAPHEAEDCKLSFTTSSMEGEVYQMWYLVGGGGGHSLTLLDGRIHTVIFDDEQGNVSRNYEILKTVGAIAVHPESSSQQVAKSTFYPQLLLRVSRLLRMQWATTQRNKERSISTGSAASNGVNDSDGNHCMPETNAATCVPPPPQDDSLAAFFRMFMIPLTEGSLLAVEEIIQSSLDEKELVVPEPVPEERSDEFSLANFLAWGAGGAPIVRLEGRRNIIPGPRPRGRRGREPGPADEEGEEGPPPLQEREGGGGMVWRLEVGNFGANIAVFAAAAAGALINEHDENAAAPNDNNNNENNQLANQEGIANNNNNMEPPGPPAGMDVDEPASNNNDNLQQN